MILIVIAVALFFAPTSVHAQSSNCAAGAVDYYADDGNMGMDIEQTACIYYDGESGVDTSVETDNDSYGDWQDLNSLWIYGVGTEAAVFGSTTDNIYDGIGLSDSGMVDGNTSDTGGDSVTVNDNPPWGYSVYGLSASWDECYQAPGGYDEYGCTWATSDGGPLSGQWVTLQVPYTPLPTPTLSVISSPSPFTYGQPVTFTATLSFDATGEDVDFYSNEGYIGSGTFNGTNATFSTSALAIGTYTITAYYYGDSNYGAATSNTITQQMMVTPTVGVSCSPGTTNYGVSSTCTATVSNGATGTVSFSNFGSAWAVSTLSSGTASASSPNGLRPGSYTFVANYSGDSGNYPASASTTLTVQADLSTTDTIYSYIVPTTGGYDTNGNVLSYTDTVMGSWYFSYDQLNRLTTAFNTAMPAGSNWAPEFCWAYDSFGNRLAQSQSNAQFSSSGGNCSTSGTLYQNNWATYSAQNQVTGTPQALYGYAYDGAGDVTYDGANAYLYDAEGRICAVNTGSGWIGYLYDAAGNRVAKGNITNPNGTCDVTTNGFVQMAGYVVGPSGEQLTEVDGSGNWSHTNVYAGGKQIATYDGNVNAPTLHFYIDDPLGTRRAQTNASGVLEATYQSLPFGDGLNEVPFTGYNGDDPTENHFTGKERDTESGNDYFGARYYNSATGRWLSPDWSTKSDDPVPYANLTNPQSLNLYAYVGNNPLLRTDPTGHACTVSFMPVNCTAIIADAIKTEPTPKLSARDRSYLDKYYKPVHAKTKTYKVDDAQVLGVGIESSFADPNVKNNTYTQTGDAFGMTGGSTKHMTSASSPEANVSQFFEGYGNQIRGTSGNDPSFVNGLEGEDADGKAVKGWKTYNTVNPEWKSFITSGIKEMRRDLDIYLGPVD
jgi:RHS repeat-associated protein